MTTTPADTPVETALPKARASARRDQLLAKVQRHGGLAVLLIVVAVASVAFDRFLTGANVENMLLQSSFLGLIVVGMAFVIISGGIDLSVGSLLALGGVLAALLLPYGWFVALLVPPLVCGALGLVQGLLIARAGLAPFIVTLAGLVGFRGLALAVAGERTIGIADAPTFTWLGRGELFGVPVPIMFAVVVFVLGGLVLNRTAFGMNLFAVGGNEEAARLMGVPVERMKAMTYVVTGALSGLAGVLLTARLSAGQPVAGAAWELDAIAAVVVGGTLLTGGEGSMGGALVGVLLLQVMQNMINQVGTLTAYTQQMVSGAFLVIVVAAQTYIRHKRLKS